MLEKQVMKKIKEITNHPSPIFTDRFNSYFTYAIYELNPLHDMIVRMVETNTPIQLYGYSMKPSSLRYKLFAQFDVDELKCVKCGLRPSFWALQSNNKNGKPHLNLYGINDNGNIMQFTKDHIIPKSLGGGDKLNNMQVMCEKCNGKKKNNLKIELENDYELSYYVKMVSDLYGKKYAEPNQHRKELYNGLEYNIDKLNTLKLIIQNPIQVSEDEMADWWKLAMESITEISSNLKDIGIFVNNNHVKHAKRKRKGDE